MKEKFLCTNQNGNETIAGTAIGGQPNTYFGAFTKSSLASYYYYGSYNVYGYNININITYYAELVTTLNTATAFLYDENNQLLATKTKSGTISTNLSIYLFGCHTNTGIIQKAKARIYYCKLYNENMQLVRDMIPVLDNNDTPCMFDRVTKQLFYNQGTGQFLYN